MNKFGRVKQCPYCANDVRVTVNWLPFLLIFLVNIPIAILLQAYFIETGVGKFLAYVLAYLPFAIAFLLLGLKLVKVES